MKVLKSVRICTAIIKETLRKAHYAVETRGVYIGPVMSWNNDLNQKCKEIYSEAIHVTYICHHLESLQYAFSPN